MNLPLQPTYTVDEIATAFECGPQAVRKWIKDGLLPANRTARKAGPSYWLVLAADLLEFVPPTGATVRKGRPSKIVE